MLYLRHVSIKHNVSNVFDIVARHHDFNTFRLEEVLPALVPCCCRLSLGIALRVGLVCEMMDVLETHLGYNITIALPSWGHTILPFIESL